MGRGGDEWMINTNKRAHPSFPGGPSTLSAHQATFGFRNKEVAEEGISWGRVPQKEPPVTKPDIKKGRYAVAIDEQGLPILSGPTRIFKEPAEVSQSLHPLCSINVCCS